jgi:hypothetical protein
MNGVVSTRALVPREHGAYAELAVPMLTALTLRPPTPASIAWAVAGVAAFFAHEPLLVVLGRRGERSRSSQARSARVLFAVLATISVVAAIFALVRSPPAAKVGAALPAALAILVGVVLARREERTATGELLVSATLAGAALPVALASSVPIATSCLVWIVFAFGLGAATLAVRAVIQCARGTLTRAASLARALAAGSLLVVTLALSFARVVPAFAPLAAAPLVVFSVVLHLAPPSPRHLRTLGWLLVCASILGSVIVRGLA